MHRSASDTSDNYLSKIAPLIIIIIIICLRLFIFFRYLKRLPDDIWLVDLDSNKLQAPTSNPHEEIPPLPEPEGTILKNHLKQVRWYLLYICFSFIQLLLSFYIKYFQWRNAI